MLHLGFTGTRKGLSEAQRDRLLGFRQEFGFSCTHAHHGDAVGGDTEWHQLWRRVPRVQLVIHPPISPKWRAFLKGDIAHEPKDYHSRNEDIVHFSDLMFACPLSDYQRGGTWHAIGVAQQLKKPLWIIFHNGAIHKENC